jgi:Calcium binding
MARTSEQADREKRITYEAVVDAYDGIERAMGWYYYMEGKLKTPFTAECKAKRGTSPLAMGESVQVTGMADQDDCIAEIMVLIKYGKSHLAVPLDQLKCLSTDAQTCEAVDDWHYWVARGYAY